MEVGARPVPNLGITVAEVALEADLVVLRAHARTWARLAVTEKIRHLRAMRARTVETAQAWVDLAAEAKGIAGTALVGEEWLSGPYPLLTALDRLTATLAGIARDGGPPVPPRAVRTRPDGQVVVDVFPVDRADAILLNGVRAEVWMEPEVTRETLSEHTASFYRQREPEGAVTLVLGAGNIAAIPPLDALYALYAHGGVVRSEEHTSELQSR